MPEETVQAAPRHSDCTVEDVPPPAHPNHAFPMRQERHARLSGATECVKQQQPLALPDSMVSSRKLLFIVVHLVNVNTTMPTLLHFWDLTKGLLHLRDPGLRIVQMYPVFVGSLLRTLPVHRNQILSCRRLNPRSLCQLHQSILVAAAILPAYDRPHPRLQRRSVHTQRLVLQQSRSLQQPQHKAEHRCVRLHALSLPCLRSLLRGFFASPYPKNSRSAKESAQRHQRAPSPAPPDIPPSASECIRREKPLDGSAILHNTPGTAPPQTHRIRAAPTNSSTPGRTDCPTNLTGDHKQLLLQMTVPFADRHCCS